MTEIALNHLRIEALCGIKKMYGIAGHTPRAFDLSSLAVIG